MNRSILLPLGLLLFSELGFGQSTTSDSQTLQALLSELRQLRQDLQTTTVAAQRAHILLYRLQGQEAIVARASEHLYGAREKLARIQDERRHVAAEIKQHEKFVDNTENTPNERKDFENRLPDEKARLEFLESSEQQQQTLEIEAERYLQEEETRLNELREQLERLDKTLQIAGHRENGSVQ